MTTNFMLRVASAISALFTIGHSLGGLQHWSPVPDNPVLQAMAATHFHVMGVSRSYLQLYEGLGWTVSVFMALQTVLLWQLASLARSNLPQARAMVVPFILAALACGIVAWRLVLPVPALFSAALLVALLLAWLAERPRSRA
jgi:hypothetical protein